MLNPIRVICKGKSAPFKCLLFSPQSTVYWAWLVAVAVAVTGLPEVLVLLSLGGGVGGCVCLGAVGREYRGVWKSPYFNPLAHCVYWGGSGCHLPLRQHVAKSNETTIVKRSQMHTTDVSVKYQLLLRKTRWQSRPSKQTCFIRKASYFKHILKYSF